MKEGLARALGMFDARSVRERVLIGLTVLALTWVLWIASIGGLMLDHKAEVITSIDRLAQDLRVQSNERLRLQREDTAPARRALSRQQERLQEVIVVQQAELDELLRRFIRPEDVPILLEDVLRKHSGLKLVRLSSMPAAPLTLEVGAPGGHAQAADAAQFQIYRHPVQLEFEGGYQQVLDYLLALEAVSWRFAWRKFEYAVSEYPAARVLIELETLSREREWLGV